MADNPAAELPELLDRAFVLTDEQLADRKGLHSGCTAIVAYLRMEEHEEGEAAAATEEGTGEQRQKKVSSGFGRDHNQFANIDANIYF